jgi:hypothetical protein
MLDGSHELHGLATAGAQGRFIVHTIRIAYLRVDVLACVSNAKIFANPNQILVRLLLYEFPSLVQTIEACSTMNLIYLN